MEKGTMLVNKSYVFVSAKKKKRERERLRQRKNTTHGHTMYYTGIGPLAVF